MSDKEIIAQQAETIQLLKEVLKNLSGRGNNGFDPEITFGQCVDMYLKHLEKCAKTSSYFSAQWKCSRLERFNDMPVCDINKADIQNFVDEIAGHYAPKTVKELITQMKTILNYAAKMDLIPDKTFIVDIPRIEKKEYRVLNTKEYNKLRMMVIDENKPCTTGMLLMLETGMRIGEACGMQWKDVDFKRRVININKTVFRVPTGIMVDTPKTPSSRRTIPMTETLYETLKERRQAQGIYIASGRETCTEPRTLRQAFDRRLKRWGVEHIKPHELRHSFATRAIEKGVDPKTVAALLGHKNCNITLDIYTNATDKMLKAGIKKMN